ncbi:major facilitator superfamily transporter [Colletotrichum graminicola]|uniref:Major facilitator superfamily transporter n=1 Tax=Colletotrichum graminicola (strain M1.001 / M2 / FGSC 10212) TaxID=645133 RepID=E3QU71_COLGM|nr:major facilitator superfamily transporter [Colletotrichum graminicola M1.001]EFQ34409.1 major facilitator superfamily transporter [Colletotrichum graminicola M1.001]WDK08891.1 major facilitator superfamily transporter [Colletotrichum graminicola]
MDSKYPEEKLNNTTTSAYASATAYEQHSHHGMTTATHSISKQDHSFEDGKVVYPSGLKLVLIIISLCLAVFLVALDQTIIAPALGTITANYGTVKDIGWYGAAYLLTTTALQPMYGTIYKLFSIKWAYLGAIAIFETGSLICALAPTSTAFIVGRAVAGIGTAGLVSGSIVIISYTMPLQKRPIAIGLIGGMWGVASVAGPLLGGVFTEKATWRWCFYVNLPVGGMAMLFIVCLLTIDQKNNALGESVFRRIMQLDLIGTAIFIPAIICLILALQWGGSVYAWRSATIIGLLVGSVLMAAIFVVIQLWQGDSGTLPPKLFKNRNVLCSFLFGVFFSAGFFPLIYYLSIYFQVIQGASAVQAGIKILPFLLSSVVATIGGGALISYVGYYNAVAIPSVVLYAVGNGLITTFDVDTPMRAWFGYQVIAGLGTGACFQLGMLVVQTVLPQEDVPVASACVQFFQALGGAIMIAVCQTLFQTGIISGVTKNAPGINPAIFINSGADQVRGILTKMGRVDLIPVVLEAYMVGLRHTFYVAVAGACGAFLVCLGLQWKSVKQQDKGGAAAVVV